MKLALHTPGVFEDPRPRSQNTYDRTFCVYNDSPRLGRLDRFYPAHEREQAIAEFVKRKMLGQPAVFWVYMGPIGWCRTKMDDARKHGFRLLEPYYEPHELEVLALATLIAGRAIWPNQETSK